MQFHTFGQTLLSLFHVAIFSGWIPIMNATVKACASIHNPTWVSIFFFAYRITMANVVIPIFVGFLTESFVSQVKAQEAPAFPNSCLQTTKHQHLSPHQSSPHHTDESYTLSRSQHHSDVQEAMFDVTSEQQQPQRDIGRLQDLLKQKERKIAHQDQALRRFRRERQGQHLI